MWYGNRWRSARAIVGHMKSWAVLRCRSGAERAVRAGGPAIREDTPEWNEMLEVYWDAVLDWLDVDHVNEISEGGGHVLSNLQLLTTAAHMDKTVGYYRERAGW